MSEKIPSLCLAMPVGSQMRSKTAVCLAQMYAHLAQNYVSQGQLDMRLLTVGSAMLCSAREELARHALSKDADWVLWVDSDMTFPPDSAAILIDAALRSGNPVVGAGYCQRVRPVRPTMKRGPVWFYNDSEPDEFGLVPVEFMGMGLCLMAADVFRSLDPPWFPFNYDVETGRYTGEDVHFFRLCKKHLGIEPHIHVELTNQVGHIGEHVFTMMDADEDKPALVERIEPDPRMPHQIAREAG